MTVLAVAHRIKSFLHFDSVLVLDKGKVVQYESMDDAIRKKDSPFSKMLEIDEKE